MKQFMGPTYSEMMPQLLEAIQALGGSGTIDELDQKTIEILQLPDEVLCFPHGNSNNTEVEYRLAWTRTYLKKAGILDNSSRGVWSLTAVGRTTTAINPAEIVKQVRDLTALATAHTNAASADDDLENDGVELPEEIQSWREKLKNVLLNMSPDAFERLAQRLLRESGFTQVEVTGRTGDGGIDGTGIIKLHGMISFHMLFQCKRYQGSVSASEMRDFRGAMQGRADKGIFITTGKFTAGAVQEANRPGTTPIDLMDGDELMDRLRDLRLGVEAVADYRVEQAWFASI